jgi:transcription elongation factor GreA-like protein
MSAAKFRKGDIIRRNRRPGEVDKVTSNSVHIKVLTDFTFRVFSSEIIPLDKADVMLRKRPRGCYTWTLVKDPDRIEKMCSSDIAGLMALILREWQSPFGKREFKQILFQDDQVVAEDQWNSFWTKAYKAMREDRAFSVDDRSRYTLAEEESS